MKAKHLKSIVVASVFGLLSLTSYSQEKEEENTFKQLIQEFPFSTSVYVQEKNEIQLTGSYFHAESDEEIGNNAGFEMEYGILDGFQVSGGYSYSHNKAEDGSYHINALEAGTMFSFFNNAKNSMALSVEAQFPLNSLPEENEEDKPSYESTLSYGVQFGKTQIHLNAGAELQNEKVSWIYNVAAVYGEGYWHPMLELNTEDEEEFNTYLGPGVNYNCESGWELSSGIRHGLNNDNWAASIKLIYEFKVGAKENS